MALRTDNELWLCAQITSSGSGRRPESYGRAIAREAAVAAQTHNSLLSHDYTDHSYVVVSEYAPRAGVLA